MLNLIRPVRLSILLFLFLGARCHDSKDVTAVYKSYTFDPKVIDKLPAYDSLAVAILEKMAFFQQHMDKNESYRAYRYMPQSDESEVFKTLHPEVAPAIEPYYTKLGKDFVYGFDVFQDSTIKIYIRSTPSDKPRVDIDENLSYYPLKSTIRRREFPDKDTILNDHWQYWTRINRHGVF